MKCSICEEPMVVEKWRDAGADYWVGPVPADDDEVYTCWGCGEVVAK